jgi:hypothetical protein
LTTWWTTQRKYAAQDASPYIDFAKPNGEMAETEIRPPADQLVGLAISLRLGIYDPKYTGVPTDRAIAITTRLIGSVAHEHIANMPKGWGNAWQSASWAANCGEAGWLMWDKLTPTDQEYVRKMVEHEADRFLTYKVPYYMDRTGRIITPGDTKSEENAWNSMVLHMAIVMMPHHPHWNGWMQKDLELMVSSFARPADLNNHSMINGKPISEWINGTNSYDDGTLVNHNRVHPDYMTAGLFEFSPIGIFTLAHRPVPAAGLFNCDYTYHALTDVNFVPGTTPYPIGGPIQPPGGTIYRTHPVGMYFPQGNDWGSLREMNYLYADVLADAMHYDHMSTTKAAFWENIHGKAQLAMQARFPDGRTYGAASEDGFHAREEWVSQKAASACLVKWSLAQGPVKVTNAAITAP